MFKLEITDGNNSYFNLQSFSSLPSHNSPTKVILLKKRSTTLKIGTIPITVGKDFEQTTRYFCPKDLRLFLSRSPPKPTSPFAGTTDLVMLGVPSEMSQADFLQFLSASIRNILQIVWIENSLLILQFTSYNEAKKFHTEYSGIQFMANRPEYCQIGILSKDLPTSLDIRLPTCPLCMERLDASITGIPTSKCDHAENICKCMLKWKTNNDCSICQVLLDKSNVCCGNCNELVDTLWICMICASIGCGRYAKGHARQHYEANPSHAFAIDLEFQRIWDYSSDRYVHRIIHFVSQNKIVDFPGPSVPSEFSHEFYSECEEKKVRRIGLNSNERITNEPTNSNQINNEIIRNLNSKCDQLQNELDRYKSNELIIEAKQQECDKLNNNIMELRTNLKESNELIVKVKADNKELNSIIIQQKSDLDGERALSERLVKEIAGLRKSINELEMKNTELEDQAKDLLAHFEMQLKVSEEAKDGSLVILNKKPTKGKKSK